MNTLQRLNANFADDTHPSALAEIYQESVSLAVWRRQLDLSISGYAENILNNKPNLLVRLAQSPTSIATQLEKELPLDRSRSEFIRDIELVVDMFSCLFELQEVGLRLAVLNTAMCPKFHVDRVPCRLICTYAGAGTEWHANDEVQRLDGASVLPLPGIAPRELGCGDVALLKGEMWEGNEGRGLVHRSPSASDDRRRLVLTLDFM